MKRSKRQVEEALRAFVKSKIQEAEKPSLVNPALLTHTLYSFTVEHLDMFVEYINEDASSDDERVSPEVIVDKLRMLHKVLDAAVAMAPIQVPNELSWPSGDSSSPPRGIGEQYPGMYL